MNATQGPTMPLSLNVNGLAVAAEIEPRRHLADFLRENLNLTGTHLGCEHGVCGACTLLVDGEPVRSCITFAGACSGADVTTIEGLDNDEIAIELRAAFNREHALQCGFCTPGMLVSARDLVLRLREPDERRIRLGLSGNLCRCTGYVGIVQAVRSVIAARRERGITAIVADPRRGLGPIGARIGSGLAAGAPTPKTVTARVPAPAAKVAAAFTPTDSFEQSFTIGLPPGGGVRRVRPHPRDRGLHSRSRGRAASRPRTASRAAFASDSGRSLRSSAGRPSSSATKKISPDESWGWAPTPANARPCKAKFAIASFAGEEPGTARVELAVGYALKGALAQFGRPSLVRNLAGRMIAEFSRNLEDRLTGRSSGGAPKPINLPRLVLNSLSEGVANWIKRLLALSD